MANLIGTFVVSTSLVFAPALARAQEGAWEDDSSGAQQLDEAPPAPPSELPPAAPPQTEGQASASVPPGQWVYTEQYGWIWMPYSDAFTYSPPSGYGEPYAYVYGASYGWGWLAAPWVWGIGPWPFFGVYGPARFGWYGHGWWREPRRWHYAPAYGGRSYAGRYRGGYPWPVYRGGSVGGSRFSPGRVSGGWRGGVGPRPAPDRGAFAGGRGAGFGGRYRAPAFAGGGVRSGGHGGGVGFAGRGGGSAPRGHGGGRGPGHGR